MPYNGATVDEPVMSPISDNLSQLIESLYLRHRSTAVRVAAAKILAGERITGIEPGQPDYERLLIQLLATLAARPHDVNGYDLNSPENMTDESRRFHDRLNQAVNHVRGYELAQYHAITARVLGYVHENQCVRCQDHLPTTMCNNCQARLLRTEQAARGTDETPRF